MMRAGEDDELALSLALRWVSKRELLAAMRACRLWHRAAQSALLWPPRLEVPCDDASVARAASVPALQRHVRELVLVRPGRITDAGCQSIAMLSQLTQLTLHSCTEITDEGIGVLLQRVGQCLQRLSLDGCTALTDACISHVCRSATRLTTLSLDSTHVGDAALRTLAEEACCCKTLTSLSLCFTDATDAGLCVLVPACPALLELNTDFCGSAVTGEPWFASLPPALLELSCVSCGITDGAIALLCLSPRELRKLTLLAPHMTEAGVRALGASQLPLQQLTLSACCGVTDSSLSALTAGLLHDTLLQLDISGCRGGLAADCSTLCAALSPCVGLRRLSVSGIGLDIPALRRVLERGLSFLPIEARRECVREVEDVETRTVGDHCEEAFADLDW
eukprot:TRINITY_DN529_c2_g7_i1.p2 TRINITY_DN529_c2_g7~~TRINITY_DN529_c2_g7_i1.p2  ORF type:complete len:393 (+),score=96.15 TRINITY_DN529_c2_g7_i1:259-1437(+)